MKQLPIAIIAYLLGFSQVIFAQSNSPALYQFESPQVQSPTAHSFNQYGDIPVSYHTGVPSIGIPLFSITEGPLVENISLNYHSSGVRVSEVASWVGLGWSLSAGGVITRVIKGISDDGFTKQGTRLTPTSLVETSSTGWLDNNGLHPVLLDPECLENSSLMLGGSCFLPSTTRPSCINFFWDAANGKLDSEPDIYQFSFGGYSGKFIYDRCGVPRILEEQDINIETIFNSNGNIESFVLSSPQGTRYYFGGAGATEFTHVTSDGTTPSTQNYSTQGWYLTKIESANRNQWISFSYASEKYSFTDRNSHSVSVICGQCGSGNLQGVQGDINDANTTPSLTSVDGLRLTGITTSSGSQEISFVVGNAREDLTSFNSLLSNNTESKELDEVKYRRGTHWERYSFSYSYFLGLAESSTVPTSSDHDRKRLKLTAIQKDNLSDNSEEPAYSFQYEEALSLPRRLSLARDHWGYYNGETSNTGLIPSGVSDPCGSTTWNSLADREPSETHMKLGILKQVTYPTGGYVIFDFEAHYDDISNKDVGGLRIKKIRKYDLDNTLLLREDYEYENGKLFSGYPDPQDYVSVVKGFNGSFTNYTAFGDICEDYMIMGTSYSPFQSTQGYHIGYQKVKKKILSPDGSEQNGYEEFIYNNDLTFFNSSSIGTSYGSIFPQLPPQTGLQTGNLLTHNVYDNSSPAKLISSENSTYVSASSGSVDALIATSFRKSTGPCQGGVGTNYYAIYRPYKIHWGRNQLVSQSSSTDEVSTTTDFTYSSNHGNPVELRVANSSNTSSQNKIQKSTFSFPADHFTSTYTVPDFSIEIQDLENSLTTIWNTSGLLEYILLDEKDSVWGAYVLGPGGEEYFMSYDDQINSYITSTNSECITYESDIEDELSDLATSDALLYSFISRSINPPTLAKSYFSLDDGSTYTLNGGDSVKYLLTSFAGYSSQDHLQPYESFKLNIPGNGGSSSWERRSRLIFDEDDRIASQIFPDPLISYDLINSAFLWNTNHQMVASASPANPDEIAYTSFENGTSAGDNGNWTVNSGPGGGWNTFNYVTGSIGFDLNNQRSATATIQNGKVYTLSFWTKTTSSDYLIQANGSGSLVSVTLEEGGSGGWTYIEVEIDLSGSSSGTSLVSITGVSGSVNNYTDELRLFPAHAQMSTVCYDSANRVQCQTNANSFPMFYEYDGLNRLILTKDHHGNILSKNEYKYQGQ